MRLQNYMTRNEEMRGCKFQLPNLNIKQKKKSNFKIIKLLKFILSLSKDIATEMKVPR